jgi:flagellin
MLVLNSNIPSLHVQNDLASSQVKLDSAIQRLSSGLRINDAADDAAGYAIAQRMTAQINGYDQAGQNTNDGISLMQVANGAVAQMTANFQRIRTLAVEAANVTDTRSDRQAMQAEVDQLIEENSQIVQQTNYDGVKLLDGSFVNQQLQIGANANQTLQLTIPQMFSANDGDTGTVLVPLQQATVTGQPVSGLHAGNLIIDGITIGTPAAGGGPGQSASSAYAIANAINAANIASLTATAQATTSATISQGGNYGAGVIAINGVGLSGFSGATGTALANSLESAINSASGSTGVSASLTGNTLTLTTSDGSDIQITAGAPGVAQALDLTSAQGTVTLTTSALPISSNIVISGTNPNSAGFTAGTFRSASTGVLVPVTQTTGSSSSIADVTSAANAQQVITFIDTQIAQCSSVDAYLGASQNALLSIQENLATSSTNLQTARARIRDTDFAAETAVLANSEIIRDAGNAMLTQANAEPGRMIRLLLP